ncbi:unnamed protein product [Schistosoma turkestanicum]|nr:unnamed protein product [Schistosoma turkestanicum]
MTHQPIKIAVEEIDVNYENYLTYLKQHEDLEKERLEKGFQLYFNAATKYLKHKSYEHRITNNKLKNKSNKNDSSRLTEKIKRKSWDVVNIPFREIPFTKENSCLSQSTNPKTVICKNLLKNSPSTYQQNEHGSQLNYLSMKNNSMYNETAFNLIHNENNMNSSQSDINLFEKLNTITFHLDIFDNWGDKTWVGLNGIEVLMNSSSSVKIYPETISIYKINSNDNSNSLIQSENLFKSFFKTTNIQDMWMTNVENLPLRIQFTYSFQQFSSKDTITLNIWNIINPDLFTVGARKCLLTVIYDDRILVLYNDILPVENSMTSVILNINEIIPFEKLHSVTNSPVDNSNESNLDVNELIPSETCRNDNKLKHNIKTRLNVWFPNSQINKIDDSTKNNLLSKVNEDLLNSSFNRINMKCITSGLVHKNKLLEESWSSLDFFDHFHKGRISMKNNISEYLSNNQLSDSLSDKLDENSTLNNSSSYFILHETKTPQTMNNSIKYYPPRIYSKEFSIPELPFGHRLILDIISTWGDQYYVGLNGIEIFTSNGMNITTLCQITANPLDINILPDYHNDPRIVTNLIDGINWTRDDTHMWLTPFTSGERHFIEITLPKWIESPIALLRIWNYNKSRVHSYRGVKELLIYLDNQPIFYGEISKASGLEFGEPEDFCETILFCTNNQILNLIGKNDTLLRLKENDYLNDICMEISEDFKKRPVTRVSMSDINESDVNINIPDDRPLSSAMSELAIVEKSPELSMTYCIEITLLEPWVHGSEYIGLTGIEFLDKTGNPIKIKSICLNDNDNNNSVFSNITDKTSDRCIENLINTKNITTDANDMWHTVYRANSSPPVLRFYPDLQNSLLLSTFNSLRIWNYNDRQVGNDYGCKLIDIKLKKLESNYPDDFILNELTILLRQAPGHTEYPFEQTILLSEFQENTNVLQNISARIKYHHLPIGFVYQFNIFSSWYDQFYVGLDGIQLLSYDGNIIPINKNEIYAYPSSVNDLQLNQSLFPDLRTVDKLVDNVISNNYNEMSKHCWLSPIIPKIINKIFIVFNRPICIAGVRLWNYMRTPERGVREFSILVDDKLLFRGYLPKFKNHLEFNHHHHHHHHRNKLFSSRIKKTNEQKLFWTNNHSSVRAYSIVSFDSEILIGLGENPQCILSMHKSSNYCDVNLAGTDMINEQFSYPSYTTRLKKINQALRPSTCVTTQCKPKDTI